jgi:hypothetical protein
MYCATTPANSSLQLHDGGKSQQMPQRYSTLLITMDLVSTDARNSAFDGA